MSGRKKTTKGNRIDTRRDPHVIQDALPANAPEDGIVWLLVPGIHHRPEKEDSWTDCARAWLHRRTTDNALRLEYWTSFFLFVRMMRTLREAARLVHVINSLPHRARIRIIIHSNGGRVMELAAQQLNRPVEEIHLVASAGHHDFTVNGMGRLLNCNLVTRVCVYASAHDGILRWLAGMSEALAGPLGYHRMGYLAATDLDRLNVQSTVCRDMTAQLRRHSGEMITQFRHTDLDDPRTVNILRDDTHNHTSWWDPARLDQTMLRITNGGLPV